MRARTLMMTFLLLAACGGGAEKSPKKSVDANNGATNNGVVNNTTANNSSNNATTGVNNEAPDECIGVAEALSFGAVQIGTVGSRFLEIENCGTEVITIDEVLLTGGFTVAEVPERVQPGSTSTVVVEFRPESEGLVSGELLVKTSVGSATVGLTGTGSTEAVACPTSVAEVYVGLTGRATTYNAFLGEVVELSAFNSSVAGGEITGYSWSMVQKPAGSTATLSATDVSSPKFTVDKVGVYQLYLYAHADNEPEGCEPGIVTITATDDQNAVVVELTWDTPGDADQTDTSGADLDLHYKASVGTWNTAPYDVCFLNNTADWGAQGQASVDLDDLDGLGPEVVSHRNATTGTYQVGVYYYSDKSLGSSTATVRVYRGQTLLAERSRELTTMSQFWEVLEVDVATNSIRDLNTMNDGFPGAE